MPPELSLIALLLLALAVACVWGATRALGGRTTSTSQGIAGAAAILGALFFGWWAVNLLMA